MMKTSYRYFIPVVTIILSLLSALSPFATDTFLSAMPLMSKHFGVEINMIEFTITLYFIGFAIGQFFGGPLSDSFGRKRIATIRLFIYGISVVWIPWCKNIETVWVLRIFQAIGGGFASVTNMAFVRDWFEGKQFAQLVSLISLVMTLAPLFAPLIGGLLIIDGNWGIVFFFMAALALIVLIILIIVFPESKKREELSYVLTGKQLMGKYKLIFSSKHTVLLVFSIGFSMAAMFAFITSASFIYLEYFHIKTSVFFILFSSGVSANIILTIINTLLIKHVKLRSLMQVGMILQLLAAISFIFTSTLTEPPFVMVFTSLIFVVGSIGLIFSNGTSLVINTFPQIGGAANAIVGVVRFTISSIICSLIAFFHTGDLIPVGIGIFLTVAISNILFLWSKSCEKMKKNVVTVNI